MSISPKVTVIIPVYNVSVYLPQCLDSVIAQTLKDIEIICVNDGSKDESLAVLQKYAAEDNRIKIIDKANAGVSAARNDGIAAATGKYIAFLDGDDLLEPECLAETYAKAEADNCSVVIFESYLFDGEKKSVWDDSSLKDYIQNHVKDSAAPYSIYDFMSVVWNKLYRTDFLKENNILFPVGIKTAEDVIFSLQCYFFKPVVSRLAKRFYDYRINRQDSLTANLSCISRDIDAFYYLEKTDVFQQQPKDVKLVIIYKFVTAVEAYIHKFSLGDDKRYMKERTDFISYLEKKYGATPIGKMLYFKKPRLTQRIFSVKNSYDKKYKIIMLFGMKFRIKKEPKV